MHIYIIYRLWTKIHFTGQVTLASSAVAFGKKFKIFGFDTSQARIAELEKFNDKTLELTSDRSKSELTLQMILPIVKIVITL